jgi:flagellar hook-basal body complex protein FliE
MSDMNVQQVLAQMRALEAQAKSQVGPETLAINEVQGANTTNFSEVLANSINTVNDNLMTSGNMAKAFEKGDSGISMAELMINMEKPVFPFRQ